MQALDHASHCRYEIHKYVQFCCNHRIIKNSNDLGNGLFPILDACSELESLDLTSCRGINVRERRRFFEVCDDQNQDGEMFYAGTHRSGRNSARNSRMNKHII